MESGCRPFRDERISGSDLDSHGEGRRAHSRDMKFICPCASKGANNLMVVFILALALQFLCCSASWDGRAESAELKRIAD